MSRAQESSSGTSKIAVLPCVASLASATSAGRAAKMTGSKEEIARATRAAACFARNSPSGPPQASLRHGQHIQVRACVAHSAGIA